MTTSPVGKTKDAGWQIGVSRTVPADLDAVWDYLVSTDGLTTWLGDGVETPLQVGQHYRTDGDVHGEIRSLHAYDRVRLTWQPPDRDHHATVQIALSATKSGCTIQFHTERLANADERERMRTHWKKVADTIEHDLANRT
jgi:uncharacterized protein YndB with AHSA1/START domain